MTQAREQAPRFGGTGTIVLRFRRDLRLHDHPTPPAARAQAAHVVHLCERAGDGR